MPKLRKRRRNQPNPKQRSLLLKNPKLPVRNNDLRWNFRISEIIFAKFSFANVILSGEKKAKSPQKKAAKPKSPKKKAPKKAKSPVKKAKKPAAKKPAAAKKTTPKKTAAKKK